MAPLAARLGLSSWLEPLHDILSQGNEAMRWLERHAAGVPLREILAEGATAMQLAEVEPAPLNTAASHPLG